MDVFKTIDDQIADLHARDGDFQEQVNALRKRRNTMSALCRLPPEILGHICHIAITIDHWDHVDHILLM